MLLIIQYISTILGLAHPSSPALSTAFFKALQEVWISKLFLYSCSQPNKSAATLWNYPQSILLDPMLLPWIELLPDFSLSSPLYCIDQFKDSFICISAISFLEDNLESGSSAPFFLLLFICSVTNIGSSGSESSSSSTSTCSYD